MQIRHTPLSGGYCGGVPPLPIPNREVKPTCADGTAMQCGRVGRRLLSMKSLRFRKISEAFLFFLLADLFLLRWVSSSLLFFIGFYGWIGRQSCLSDYSRISADIWPLANGSRQKWAPLFLSRRFRRWRRFFLIDYFSPTDFTDSHRFFHWLFFSWGFTQIFFDFLLFPVISSFFLLFLYFADFRPVGLGFRWFLRLSQLFEQLTERIPKKFSFLWN